MYAYYIYCLHRVQFNYLYAYKHILGKHAKEVKDVATAFLKINVGVEMIACSGVTDFEAAQETFRADGAALNGKIQAIDSHFVTPEGSQLVYVHNAGKNKMNLLLPFIAFHKCMQCKTVKLLVCQRWMLRILGKVVWERRIPGKGKANEMTMLTFLVRKRSRTRNDQRAEGDDNGGGGNDNNGDDDDGGGGGDDDDNNGSNSNNDKATGKRHRRNTTKEDENNKNKNNKNNNNNKKKKKKKNNNNINNDN